MSHSAKPNLGLGFDSLTDRFRKSFSCDQDDKITDTTNKPDFKELDLGSPVSPLTRPGGPTTTSSSSSSSGSVSGRNCPGTLSKKSDSGGNNNHSGELSGSVESSPTFSRGTRPGLGPCKPDSVGSTVNSPPLVNVLPAGNICPSGKVLKTGMENRRIRTDVLGSGTGNYGHGSIMRGGGGPKSVSTGGGGGGADVSNYKGLVEQTKKLPNTSMDPEEIKRAGNEYYKKGHFVEALNLYDKAISISPGNAAYHCNRAAALMGLKRSGEAVRDCEEAIRLDPEYLRAHHRLGSLLLSLGQVENARRHLCFPGELPDPTELQKLQTVEKHISRCTDARKIGDWRSALREAESAIASGADASPQLFACKAEAHLKLRKLDDAELTILNHPKFESSSLSCSQAKSFGMLCEAYPFFVRAQIEMAFGRFENAVTAVERAGQIDPRNVEVSGLANTVKLVARARARGNDLFKSERFTEACSAYGEGLRIDTLNSVLYCNRAACWYKLGKWERSLDDCNQALRIQPNYTKALLRRAASNTKLERWTEAVRDYEVLRRELPNDKDVAESLFHAQVALKKSRGEEVSNMKFGGEVELVSGLQQFRATISSPGASVVHFEVASSLQCKKISPFLDMLCSRYPSINFLKVDVEESPAIANAENVKTVPTFKIYKEGRRVKEMVCPRPEVLESSVKHYSF
ncbi:hypothetical protein LguiA_035452 [Lonicera macranthoides]